MKILTIIFVLVFALYASGQAQKVPSFADTPFDLAIKKLPANFFGNDAKKTFNSLSVLALESDCGKFERSNECQNRINKLFERQLWAGVTASDLLSFSIKIDDCDYNADTQNLRCPRFKSILQGFSNSYNWSHKILKTSRHIGQNAFGVKKSFLYRKIENIAIDIGENSKAKFEAVNISPDIARDLIPNLRMLIVGSPAPPWVKRETADYQPTLDDPTKTEGDNKTIFIKTEAIWLYDVRNGKIYGRN